MYLHLFSLGLDDAIIIDYNLYGFVNGATYIPMVQFYYVWHHKNTTLANICTGKICTVIPCILVIPDL